jgi:hypothetical protein
MFDSLSEWWLAFEVWWRELTPGSQAFLRGAAVMVVAFLAAEVVARMVGRRLRAGNFDGSLRAPWLPAPGAGRVGGWPITPSGLVSGLLRLTVWGVGVWLLATEQGWTAVAAGLEWTAGRVWSLAAVLIVGLCLARFVAGQLIEFLQSGPLSEKLDGWLPRAGALGGLGGLREPRVPSVAALAGTAVYGVVFLLVLLVAADLFGWALTGSALAAAWVLLLHVVTAGIALSIGWLGYRWARSLTLAAAETAPLPARAAHYTALGIVAGATLLAIALLATLHAVAGVAVMLLLAFVLWPLRGYVADVWAGMLLQGQKVEQVRLDGEFAKVGEVGLLTTRLQRQDEQVNRRNRVVLEAHLQGAARSNGVAE